MKTLVIAIDGADPNHVQLGIEKGMLPTLSNLVKNGSWGPLRSTMPPISSPAWITFRTGKNPGKLGLAGFFVRKETSYEVEVADFKVPDLSIWEILSQNGMRVGVVNVHLTYPPDQVNGVMISPVYARSSDYYFPPELQNTIEAKLGSLDYEVRDKEFFTNHLREEHVNLEENRFRLAQEALKFGPFDFFICGFNIDRVQHFISDEELLLQSYRCFDGIVRRMLELAQPENVFIVSDHGGGPVRGTFFVNQWLAEQGFIRLKRAPKFSSTESLISKRRIRNALERVRLFSLVQRMIPRAARNLVPTQHLSYVAALPDIDWSQSLAFCPFDGGIYLNLKGREPDGIVEPAQYEDVQTQIVTALKKVRHPQTTRPLDIVACRRQEIYAGSRVSSLPDILFFLPQYASSPAWASGFLGESGKPGDHRLEGILIASGKEIRNGVKLASARLQDVAPTLLHLMEVPIADDMDGKVLDVFHAKRSPAFRRYLPRESERGPEDDELVRERLRTLGYID